MWRTHKGDLNTSVGALVVLNSDGWVLTASHIVEMMQKLRSSWEEFQAIKSSIEAVEKNSALPVQVQRKKIAKLMKGKGGLVTDFSIFWGFPGSEPIEFRGIEGLDFAVARLGNFDSDSVKTYPLLKDPARDLLPGTSLCKLGYPFHQVQLSFDESANAFNLENGLPPFFPIEGIFTRQIFPAELNEGSNLEFPLGYIETSSPGLRGQSGGPTFDQYGTVWGIQSRTVHYPLGFAPTVKVGGKEHTEHAFLHCGLGVHPGTIVGFLKDQDIKFNVSDY